MPKQKRQEHGKPLKKQRKVKQTQSASSHRADFENLLDLAAKREKQDNHS